MKLGGLFSGVGGFELAWTQLGHEVAWMCEVDKSARKVLAARFPGVPVYDDVRDLDPAQVEAVDVLTGGSPCQGFSIAGMRTGLEHEESQLFADYVRIMDGLAERGLRYAVWENVPGLLTIEDDNGERTFEHVVAALAGETVPVRLPTDKRWGAGLAAGRRRAVAWRVLDSRYFGVAQRRRRIFACVAFGDTAEDRAGRALLAVGQGVRRHFAEGYAQGQALAAGAGARPGVPSVAGTLGAKSSGGIDDLDRMTYLPDVTHTLTGNGFDASEDGTGRGTPILEDAAHHVYRFQRTDSFVEDTQVGTLAARDFKDGRDLVLEAAAFRKARRAQTPTDDETWVADGSANTLSVFDSGESRTTHAIVEAEWAADESGTLQARGYKGLNHENARDGQAVVQTYGVRRLTPVECERLQAFPDGWTEPAGSDSARYRAMGNAVTVNVVRWILARLPL